MRVMLPAFAFVTSSILAVSCQKAKTDDTKSDTVKVTTGSGAAGLPSRPKTEQVPPPLDLKNPPADATKTPSGLVYKKLKTNDAGQAPKRNDTVMINYTGWHPSTGETFFTNRSRNQPMPLNLSTTAPGFTEAMQLVKKGEQAMLWVPADIGYKGKPQGTPEALVYEVEVIDIVSAPPIPADLASPPATAETTKSGVKYVVLKPGTGTKAAAYDTVTYNYTAWDATDGRMFDTTEMKKRPAKMQPYKQGPGLEDILTQLAAGERVRFWTTADKLSTTGKTTLGMPQGAVCYELEAVSIEPGTPPPAVPPDVAKPPPEAKKTAKGTFYKVLKAGKGGPKPKPSDSVKVNYTGWTTDGKMFDSSVVRNQPAEFSLQGVVAGWTDGIPLMSIGDTYRFWIPEELAYKGAQGRPQGMLVFDVELLEIKAPPSPDKGPPGPHGRPSMPQHQP